MKVAVIGANGRVGRLVVKESLSRGYEVTGIVRQGTVADIPVIHEDIMGLTTEDLTVFDAVVNCFGVWDESQFDLYTTTTKHLCDILSGTNVRLLIVGGAGSLYVDKAHTIQALETEGFPAEYKALATAASKALAYLRTRNDVKWTYLSPAGFFDAEGPRTGSYILGGEEAIVNSKGESYISYADYAIAMVDELENAKHIQQRFSVISE